MWQHGGSAHGGEKYQRSSMKASKWYGENVNNGQYASMEIESGESGGGIERRHDMKWRMAAVSCSHESNENRRRRNVGVK